MVFNKPYCKIYYYKESNVVHLDWRGHATLDQFSKACDFSLEIMEKHNSRKMIADNSKVSVVAIACQDWLTQNWFPRALAKGFQYSAVIVSDDYFVKFAVRRIENNIDNVRFVIQYFNELSSAKEWLADSDE
jgi:hypothetical protein